MTSYRCAACLPPIASHCASAAPQQHALSPAIAYCVRHAALFALSPVRSINIIAYAGARNDWHNATSSQHVAANAHTAAARCLSVTSLAACASHTHRAITAPPITPPRRGSIPYTALERAGWRSGTRQANIVPWQATAWRLSFGVAIIGSRSVVVSRGAARKNKE